MLIASQVYKATIYRDAARVTRTASIELEKGRTLLEFAELPADLALESLRVRAAGAPGTKLEGFSSKRVYHDKIAKSEIQALIELVENLNQSIQAQQSRISAVNARIDHLDNLLKETRSFAFGLTNQKLTISQHFETIAAIANEREKALAERSELQLGLIDLQNQFAAKKKELEQLNSQQVTAAYQIDLPVEMETGGTLNVELSYLQPGCSWEPNYDFSLQKGKLEILYTASVSQESGENWQDINVELSTAQPRTYAELPEMEPWYLQKYSPPTPRAIPNARMDRMMKSEDTIFPMSAPPNLLSMEAASYAEAEIDSLGVSARYNLTQKVTLPSQPSPSRFVISNLTLDVEEDRLAIPRLSEEIYRRVKLVNKSNLVFLAGKAALYAEDAFVGSVVIPFIPQGGEYRLNFGVDDRIEVKREIIKQSAAGKFLQDKRLRSYGYQISIANPTEETIKLVLQDQLPVSQHEEIKVRLDKADPNPDSKDDLNRMTWNLTLLPKSKKLVQFYFIVEAPTEMEIRGLPRD
ncbi:MAG: mucoidy inhibitor MuiA family protein [Chloroflexi bacterium]|nr:mucoidy inhibitor MuiA family protein [Chloroflexota bacterium]